MGKYVTNNEIIRKKIEAKCISLNDTGEGVFKDGKELASCANFLPHEVGIVEKVTSFNKSKYHLIRLDKQSNSRQTVKCSIYNKCGSCHLLHMSYEDQIKFKLDYVSNALKEYKLNSKIDEIIRADKINRYRNKMQVAYTTYNNNIVYGFYQEDTHKIIALDDCLVHSERQNEIAKAIAKIMKDLHLKPYDEDKRSGLIRFALIREAIKTKEMLVTIVTNADVFPGKNEFIKRLLKECSYITTIIQNINTRKTSIILGDDERIMYGSGYIIDELCGIKFKISSKTFYQVNPYQTELLYKKAIEYANFTGNERVLDAYCGIGTIGIVLSPFVREVIGVESNKQSVINARDNAYYNKIKNIRFINDDATKYIIENKDEKFDCIIMDPPRSGSTEEFLNAIKVISPKKIVYVSCEAKTLARDLKVLEDKYVIDKKCIVDMFVGTYHVETVVLMSRDKE